MTSFKDKVERFKKNPSYYIKLIVFKSFSRYLTDKKFLKIYYHLRTGRKLNLDNPQTFSEKIQWLKLYDRNPVYTVMADKYKSKDYIGNIIGMEHIVPLIDVWDNANKINFDSLPNKFVLKCNHDSRSWVFCDDKNELNIHKVKKFLNKKLKTNHYMKSREWSYKNIDRKIIAEKYIEDPKDKSGYIGLTDYKFFCTNGVARIMFITHDIDENSTFDAFDMNFNHLDMFKIFNEPVQPKKPKCFDDMRLAAEKISKGIPFVRVDFYIVNNQYYFGEMTFYPLSGFLPPSTSKWDSIIGEWIKLPDISNINYN